MDNDKKCTNTARQRANAITTERIRLRPREPQTQPKEQQHHHTSYVQRMITEAYKKPFHVRPSRGIKEPQSEKYTPHPAGHPEMLHPAACQKRMESQPEAFVCGLIGLRQKGSAPSSREPIPMTSAARCSIAGNELWRQTCKQRALLATRFKSLYGSCTLTSNEKHSSSVSGCNHN